VKPTINRIFISKNADELPALRSFCVSHNISLQAQSLLKFKANDFEVKNPFDIVFFSSIRAAEFFLLNAKLNGALVACIGNTTAEKLRVLGIQPDFIGENSGNPAHVAEAFQTYVGHRRVLIPCSDISARSMVKALPSDQVEEVVVYETQTASVAIPPCDVYVFTSPSSVDAFLHENDAPEGLAIAWGTTTEAQMIKRGMVVSFVLKTASEDEVVEVISSLLV
jgi:uroporphyrinogen-III synthase